MVRGVALKLMQGLRAIICDGGGAGAINNVKKETGAIISLERSSGGKRLVLFGFWF